MTMTEREWEPKRVEGKRGWWWDSGCPTCGWIGPYDYYGDAHEDAHRSYGRTCECVPLSEGAKAEARKVIRPQVRLVGEGWQWYSGCPTCGWVGPFDLREDAVEDAHRSYGRTCAAHSDDNEPEPSLCRHCGQPDGDGSGACRECEP